MTAYTMHYSTVIDGQDFSRQVQYYNGNDEDLGRSVAINMSALSANAKMHVKDLRLKYRRPVYVRRFGNGWQTMLDPISSDAMLVLGDW